MIQPLSPSPSSAARLYRKALALARNTDPVPVAAVRALLERAARAGHPKATWVLGNWAHHGVGEPASTRKAMRHWLRAAALGDAEAKYDLATTYALRGGPRNDRVAFRWYEAAAAGGDAQAMTELCRCYRDGTGVDADPRLAFEWGRRAGARGQREAASWVSRFFRDGYGCRRSKDHSALWRERARRLAKPDTSPRRYGP